MEYPSKHLVIALEVGDRAGEGLAYGNLGCAYHSLGQFEKAVEYHSKHLAIALEVGDRAGVGIAYTAALVLRTTVSGSSRRR